MTINYNRNLDISEIREQIKYLQELKQESEQPDSTMGWGPELQGELDSLLGIDDLDELNDGTVFIHCDTWVNYVKSAMDDLGYMDYESIPWALQQAIDLGKIADAWFEADNYEQITICDNLFNYKLC